MLGCLINGLVVLVVRLLSSCYFLMGWLVIELFDFLLLSRFLVVVLLVVGLLG